MLDLITGPLRSLLGEAEHVDADVESHVPTAQLEARLDEAVAAVHRAADSMERHVAVVELERLFRRRHGPASPMVHERPVAPPAQDASPGGEGVPPPPPPPPRQA